MNRIKKHYPGFADPPEGGAEEVDFETVEQLLSIEWVDRWKEIYGERFIRFSKDEANWKRNPGMGVLMAEHSDEKTGQHKWWVVGFIKEIASVDLPIFVPTPRQ